MNKNVWLLFASNAFAFSVAPVTVFLSGIIGTSIQHYLCHYQLLVQLFLL